MIPMESVGITNEARHSDRQGCIGSRKARHIRSSGGSARRTGLSRTTAHGSHKGHIRAVRIKAVRTKAVRFMEIGIEAVITNMMMSAMAMTAMATMLATVKAMNSLATAFPKMNQTFTTPTIQASVVRSIKVARTDGTVFVVEWSSVRSAAVPSRRFQISTKLRKRSSEVVGETSDTHAHTEKVS